MNFGTTPDLLTFLFTDIEGSTRLWEQQPELMRPALARHDALARATIEKHRGIVVKMSGDGVHAAFGDALDALAAALLFQQEVDALAAVAGKLSRAAPGGAVAEQPGEPTRYRTGHLK